MPSKVVILFIIIQSNVFATTISKGTTYNIVEPDTLTEIEQKTKNLDLSQLQKNYKLSQSIAKLPVATDDKVFSFYPQVILPFAVTNGKGKVIYPKGYSFNPLEYTTLPYKVAVVGSVKQYRQMSDHITTADVILVANTNILNFREQTNTKAFILTSDAIKRLGVKKVPSIIKQNETKFIINEYKVESNE
jgi:conjugal transfer pilus assembly protein TraU